LPGLFLGQCPQLLQRMTQILKALNAVGARSFPEVRAFCEGPPYHLRVSERGGLYGLRYQKPESDFKLHVVRQARGIVLEKDTNRIVSWGFDKFYEYGEDGPSYRNRPTLRKSVSDPSLRYERKYDGVLVKVVKLCGGDLLVSTNGKIDAADAPLLDPGWRPGPGGQQGQATRRDGLPLGSGCPGTRPQFAAALRRVGRPGAAIQGGALLRV